MARHLPALLIALVLILAFGARAAAADKTAEELLEGQAFTITVMADKNKLVDKIVFTAKDLGCPALGMAKTPYTATKGDAKHKKDIAFTAEVAGSNGARTKISGTVSGDEISGTIVTAPKTGEAKTLQFSGAKAGTKK